MLYLLPISKILQTLVLFGILFGASIFALFGADAILSIDSISYFVTASSLIVVIGMITLAVAWRFTPRLQESHFPYLGGEWIGKLKFETEKGPREKSVNLEIRHNLFEIDIILETDESISRTLAAHAEKRKGFARFRLIHVYENERKEGVADAGVSHRGTTIFRISSISDETIDAEYYTEKHTSGTICMSRRKTNSPWMPWR